MFFSIKKKANILFTQSALTTTVASFFILDLIGSQPVLAIQLNRGFESGNFAGWETIGDTSVQMAGNPPEGNFQALLTNFDPGGEIPVGGGTPTFNFSGKPPAFWPGTPDFGRPNLQEFLSGFAVPDLNELGLGVPIEGSAIATLFTLENLEAVEFQWNFLTEEPFAEGPIGREEFNDFAFVAITNLNNGQPLLFQKLADVQTGSFKNSERLFVPFSEEQTAPFFLETGFQNFRFVPEFQGTPIPVALVLGVVDADNNPSPLPFNNFSPSALLIDNTRVPEPVSTIGLLGLGFWGFCRKKFRKKGEG